MQFHRDGDQVQHGDATGGEELPPSGSSKRTESDLRRSLTSPYLRSTSQASIEPLSRRRNRPTSPMRQSVQPSPQLPLPPPLPPHLPADFQMHDASFSVQSTPLAPGNITSDFWSLPPSQDMTSVNHSRSTSRSSVQPRSRHRNRPTSPMRQITQPPPQPPLPPQPPANFQMHDASLSIQSTSSVPENVSRKFPGFPLSNAMSSGSHSRSASRSSVRPRSRHQNRPTSPMRQSTQPLPRPPLPPHPPHPQANFQMHDASLSMQSTPSVPGDIAKFSSLPLSQDMTFGNHSRSASRSSVLPRSRHSRPTSPMWQTPSLLPQSTTPPFPPANFQNRDVPLQATLALPNLRVQTRPTATMRPLQPPLLPPSSPPRQFSVTKPLQVSNSSSYLSLNAKTSRPLPLAPPLNSNTRAFGSSEHFLHHSLSTSSSHQVLNDNPPSPNQSRTADRSSVQRSSGHQSPLTSSMEAQTRSETGSPVPPGHFPCSLPVVQGPPSTQARPPSSSQTSMPPGEAAGQTMADLSSVSGSLLGTSTDTQLLQNMQNLSSPPEPQISLGNMPGPDSHASHAPPEISSMDHDHHNPDISRPSGSRAPQASNRRSYSEQNHSDFSGFLEDIGECLHDFLDPVMGLLVESFDDLDNTLRASNEKHDTNIALLSREINALKDPRTRSKRKKQNDEEDDPRMRHPFRSTFLYYLRCHFLRLLKLENIGQLHTVLPLTQEEQQAYSGRRAGCINITSTNWRYDFSQHRDFSFNLEAEQVFAQSFVEALQAGSYTNPNPVPLEFRDVQHIRASFHVQLKYLISVYESQVQPNPSKVRKTLARKAQARRKENLHMARDLLVTTSEKYACHRQIFEYGGIASVSSDESELDSDGGVTIKGYEVIKPVWRSKAFEKLHHDIDDDIKKSRYPTKRNHHHVPGNKPRVRIPSERINMVAIAPPYLPRNCYDESWLTSLRPWELQELSIADWDYDFENRLTGPNV